MPTPDEYRQMLDTIDAEAPPPPPTLALEVAHPKPDLAAQAVDLQDKTALPVPATAEGVAAAEYRYGRRVVRNRLSQAPKTREWLSTPENADVASDDTEALTGLEWVLKTPGKALAKGRATNELGLLGFDAMFRGADDGVHDRLGFDEAQAVRAAQLKALLEQDLGAEGLAEDAWANTFELIGQFLDPTLRALPRSFGSGMAAGGAVAIAGQLGPQVALPEELVTVPATTALVTGLTLKSSLIAEAFRTEAGHAYLEFMEMQDIHGAHNMDRDVARGAAIVAGTLNAALEGLGLNIVMGATGIDRIFGRGRLLRTPTVREALKRAGAGWAKAWAGEVSTELVQEMVTATAGEVAKMVDEGTFDAMTSDELVARLADIAYKVGTGMVIPAGAGVTATLSYDVAQAQKAKTNQEAFQALGAAAEASQLRERLPGRLQEFVEHVTADGPVEAVYIDTNALTEYFQSQGVPIEQIISEVPSLGTQPEAFGAGADVRIPIGEYTAKLAGTEHHAGLLRHLKFRPDDMSIAQAEAFERDFGQQLRDEIAAEAERVEGMSQAEEGADQVYREVTEQLVAAGRDPQVAQREALVWRAFFRTMGERVGIDPSEAFAAVRLRVQAPELEALTPEAMAQRVPGFREWFGESKVVDAEQRPQVMYHGTTQDVAEFKRGVELGAGLRHPSLASEAFWFSPHPEIASEFAMLGPDIVAMPGANVMPVYLGISNPFEMRYAEQRDYTVAELAEQGYDGVHMTDSGDWLAFYPEQIKSAVGNVGRFDPDDPRVLYQSAVLESVADVQENLSPWRQWFPSRVKGSKKLRGAPEWVNAAKDKTAAYRKLRALARQLTEEGVAGRFWYEDAGDYVMQVTRGNVIDAEKFIQLLAIYSPQNNVWANTLQAVRAYNQWKAGVSREDYYVRPFGQEGAAVGDEAAKQVLYDGKTWGGRKTNSFYLNLMHQVVKGATDEQVAQMQIDEDLLARINQAVTVDMWVKRALGYENDSTADDKGTGAYSFQEGVLSRIARELNEGLEPGAAPWLPHQVQASLWTAIKARMQSSTAVTGAVEESSKKGTMDWDQKQGKWVPPKNKERLAKHRAIWRRHALALSPEETAREIEVAKLSFSDMLARLTEAVTWEALPSAKLGAKINTAPPELQRAYTEAAHGILVDESGVDLLAKQIGVELAWSEYGVGGYDGGIVANVVTSLVPPKGQGPFPRTEVDLYARAIQYIFQQDAVPWFRADAQAKPAPFKVQKVDKKGEKRTVPGGGAFETIAQAREFIAAKKDPEAYNVLGDALARGVSLKWQTPLTPDAEESFFATLREELGNDVGFTRISSDEVVVINFRDENGVPWLVEDDAEFVGHVARVGDVAGAQATTFWSEGDYGPEANWSADPEGASLLSAGGLADRPDLHAWLRDRRAQAVEVREGFERNAAIQAAAAEQALVLHQERAGREPVLRGSVRFADGETVISLFKEANLSTFLHETGHVFLELLRDYAGRAEASDQVRADMQTVLDWLGVGPTSAIEVEHHEQWARGFEAYLREGRAPSPELESAFARFKAWLLRIYRDIRSLDVELTDEIREVFDRLLASDAEIEAARAHMNMRPLFTETRAAGMSQADQQAYLRLVAQDTEEAKKRLQAKVMQEMARGEREWWRTERKQVAAEVAAEVNARPIYQALNFLQHGEFIDRPTPARLEPFKIDEDAMREEYGEGIFAHMPAGPKVYAKQGVHPDTAAELLGLQSGAELVIGLQSLPARKKLIAQETQRIMEERHGAMHKDGTLREAALDAVHQASTRMQVLERELSVLARRVNTPPTPRQAARAAARQALSNKRVADAVRSGPYLVAERKYARAAERALMKRDHVAALQAKRQQLINHHLYVESRNIAREVEAGVKLAKRLGQKGVRKQIDVDYLDQIDALLHDYDFSRSTSLTKQAERERRRQSLREFVERKEAENESIRVPQSVLDDVNRTTYKALRVDEFTALIDALKNLRHLGRTKNKLLTDRAKRQLDQAVDDAVATMQASVGKRPKRREIGTHAPEAVVKEGIQDWFASHRKLSSLVRAMDGYVDAGVLWNLVIRPMNERGDWQADQNAKATKGLLAIFQEHLPQHFTLGQELRQEMAVRTFGAVGKPALLRKVYFEHIDFTLRREEMIGIALNWGNETNRKRVMSGYGWSEDQVSQILDRLNEGEWRFVQGVWDYLDTYWEQIAEKERRVSGVVPKRVEPLKVQTRYGEFRGGYYPIKFDHKQDPKAESKLAEQAAKDAMRGAIARQTTQRGHTRARVEGDVDMPVRLDFGVMFEHVHQVVHDLAWHEWLIDFGKLLNHKRFRRSVVDLYGLPVYKQLKSGLEAIATGDVAAQTIFERSVNWLRTGVSIAGMGWSIWTSLLQPTGLSQAVARVGPKYMGRALVHWLGDTARMNNTVAMIHAKSMFMRNRTRTQLREINEVRNRVRRAGATTAVQDSFFWLITRAQMVADVPTWLGAYEKAIDTGADEDTAVQVANQAVLDTQAGGQVKDLAQIQRGSPLMKLWTNFYSYFSATYQLTAEAVGRARTQRSPAALGRLAVDLLFIYALPATLTALMHSVLRGEGLDDEELAEKIVRENLSYMLGTMVGLRELGSAAQGYYGYEGPAGTRFFSELSNVTRQVAQAEMDAPLFKALNNAAGIALHYPAAQVARTTAGFVAMTEDGETNPMVLLFGPRREQ